jgi:hypothetical protein
MIDEGHNVCVRKIWSSDENLMHSSSCISLEWMFTHDTIFKQIFKLNFLIFPRYYERDRGNFDSIRKVWLPSEYLT